MIDRDPIDALQSYFQSGQVRPNGELQLADVYRAKNRRAQKAFGGACGFAVGAAVAITILLLAARPVPSSAHGTGMSALARYQMINSGLAVRHTSRIEAER